MTILKKVSLGGITMKRAIIITFCLYFLLILANIVLEKNTLFYGWSYIIFLLLFYVIFLAFITNFKQKGVLNLLQTNFSIRTELLLYGLVGSIAIILIGLSLQYCYAYLNPDLEIKPPQRINIIYLVFYIIGAGFEELFFRKYIISEFSKKIIPNENHSAFCSRFCFGSHSGRRWNIPIFWRISTWLSVLDY